VKEAPSRAIGRRRVLEVAALLGVAALTPARAANAQISRKATPAAKTRVAAMSNDLSADEIRTLLQLEPNATCGFVRVTFVSKQSIAAGGLPAPFADGRPLGSALYFMVTPVAPVRLHRIRNDQLYHYYLGDPIELFLLHADGRSERVIVGPDLRGGQRVQQLIPGNTFHTARLIGRRRWFLGATPSGRAWCRPTWKSATSTNSRQSTRQSPLTCSRSPRRCGMSRPPAPIAARRYVALAATASISIKKSGP
jgi:predicted cupin superfamily sugar epimerase